MIKVLLFLIPFMFLFCQNKVNEKFKIAYDYVVNDVQVQSFFSEHLKNKDSYNIFVADSIVLISTYSLLDHVVKIKYGKDIEGEKFSNLRSEEYLRELEKGQKFKSYILNELDRLNSNRKVDLILFFSSPTDKGILLAELLPCTSADLNKSIKEIRMFNKSITYLFHFDDTSHLIDVFSNQGQYN